jgi:hypothetical protein
VPIRFYPLPFRHLAAQNLGRPKTPQQFPVQTVLVLFEKLAKTGLVMRSNQPDPSPCDRLVIKPRNSVSLRKRLDRRTHRFFRLLERQAVHTEPRQPQMVGMPELRSRELSRSERLEEPLIAEITGTEHHHQRVDYQAHAQHTFKDKALSFKTEDFTLNRYLLPLALSVSAFAFAQPPEIPYQAVPDFLKLPPDMYLGEVAGVAVNSKRHVFVFSRGSTTGPAYGAAAAQLLEFDQDGKYLREIGKNLYAWSFAHAVRVDKDDNIWAIDKGSDMIIKFNPQAAVEMVFGRKKEAADENDAPWTHVKPPRPAVDGQFRQPTDVTWDPAGNIFISDGYVNSRIAKFDKNGDWVKQWGRAGSEPGEFNTPHSIASDAAGNIYVADRGNRRIQVFDSDGKLVREIKLDVSAPPDAQPWMGPRPGPQTAPTMQPGSPWALCITPGPQQVLFVSDAFPGRIYKLSLDGKILGMLGKTGHLPKQFGWIHEMACPSENELYVAELLNWRVQKLQLNPER